MSRRTFIKQWNPAVPIGGRGRGRRKKGSDPDKAFSSAFRTVHDPADDRRPAGRDADGSTRFYSASGLTTTGIPMHDDRFRAHTLSTRGGRAQQRVGMFRNAIQSNVIFGGPSERVLRHSRKKIDRLIAPESDVPESVGEWRRSPQRNSQRRRDVYEYDSEDEDEGQEEPPRYRPARRVSNQRRPPEQRRDPEYDPYEFRDDESEDEAFSYQPPPPRQRQSTARLAVVGPSNARAPSAYARDRLRGKDERVRPRRLFDGATDEEAEEMGRRPERRGGEERGEVPRMEKRTSKRVRELSPARLPLAASRHPVARRHSQQRREAVAAAPAAATPVVRFGDQETVADDVQKENQSAANYTPSIAMSIARRILSGLPPIRLKEGDGSESYLAASRSIISGALERFTSDEQDEGDADPPADRPPSSGEQAAKNPGRAMMRALFERTQHINVSEESEEEEDDSSGKEGQRVGAFENIFSRHTSDSSPVLERLFNKTMREAAHGRKEVEEEEEEIDTANMLGLGDVVEQRQQSGFEEIGEDPFAIAPRTAGDSTVSASRIDPFAIAPRTAGESTSSGSSEKSSSTSSLFHNRGHRNVSMAAAHHSLALMAPPPRESQLQLQQTGAVGSGGSSRSTSPDRSVRMGGATVGRSFHFQMNGTKRAPVPPNNYLQNNNDGSFIFEF